MKSWLFQILPIDESFGKALFSSEISVDGRPNCRKKARVHMNVVLRSTMNTNGGTENLL